ncbi:MAG: hypothetical protein ABSA79_05450 [Candidatus Bathyarchaeia archaeon]
MTKFVWHSLLKWEIKLNIIIWVANCLIFILLTLLDHNISLLTTYFSKASFLETGIAFLVGGILVFSSSALTSKAREYISKSEEHWSIDTLKIGEKRANKYLLLAIILFIESIIISILGY